MGKIVWPLDVPPIPGHEERNAEYLLEAGAAMKAHDFAGVKFRLRQLLANPGRLSAMRERALAVANPHAAATVLNHVMSCTR